MATMTESETTRRYLSRLRLNLRSRDVRKDIANSQALHRRLLDAFPDATTRAGVDLLYRLEARDDNQFPDYVILVQSSAKPDWSRLNAGYLRDESSSFGWPDDGQADVKEVSANFARISPGDQLRFRLRANPTKKYHYREGDVDENGTPRRPTGPNGTRIPLFDDAELHEWIQRKAEQHGFRVLGARWQPDPVTGDRQRGEKVNDTRLVHYAVLFDGLLDVTEVDRFKDALASGIGPAKAYGFGLLSLAPVHATTQ